ncbi:MAG: hypothetical protein HC830_14145 [Bacteroidetes bacterium]|nr:hypothetical protein [Bacteroidota bacterium]
MSFDFKYMELSNSKCKPCEAGVPPLTSIELDSYREDPKFNWEILDNKKNSEGF